MPRRNAIPATSLRRPAEPVRPLPAQKLSATTYALRTRRRRYTAQVPRQAGERGW